MQLPIYRIPKDLSVLLAWLFFFIAVDFKDHKSTVLACERIKQTNKQKLNLYPQRN